MRPTTPQARSRPSANAGFTYLWLLIFVALQGALLAVAAPSAAVQMQREKERELAFRGQQYQAALNAYARATVLGQHCRPRSLEELLEDRRSGSLKRHLRRLYVDPWSGQMDWALQRDAAGGIVSLRSNTNQIALRSVNLQRADGTASQLSDRVFAGSGMC